MGSVWLTEFLDREVVKLANLTGRPAQAVCRRPFTAKLQNPKDNKVFCFDVGIGASFLVEEVVVYRTEEAKEAKGVYFRLRDVTHWHRTPLIYPQVLGDRAKKIYISAADLAEHLATTPSASAEIKAPSRRHSPGHPKAFNKAYMAAAAQICTDGSSPITPAQLEERLLKFYQHIDP